MSVEEVRDRTVELLGRELLGPAHGPAESIPNRPDRTYLVGTLFPQPVESVDGHDGGPSDADAASEERTWERSMTLGLERSNEWMPSSMGFSFILVGTAVRCTLSYGRYTAAGTKQSPLWQRTQHGPIEIDISSEDTAPITVAAGLNLQSKWRATARGHLVTISLVNTNTVVEGARLRPEQSLYQVSCEAAPVDGSILPYRSLDALNPSEEELELELRYRKKYAFAIGHGTAVAWNADGDRATSVRIDCLPIHEVSPVQARMSDNPVLGLSRLVEIDRDLAVLAELEAFIDSYASWADEQERVSSGVSVRYAGAATRLVERQAAAKRRMAQAVRVLKDSEELRQIVSVAMVAMREQMLQSRYVESVARQHVEGDRPAEFDKVNEPRFRMFQLAFVLVALPSLMDPDHDDRDLVDLIWFPTGGGKTEAYLALASIEIVRRRLLDGTRGGGTAVLTRYTLRLLTTQQFQRAATLICALEKIRTSTDLIPSTSRFSIGLWVGNETTPKSEKDAIEKAERLIGSNNPKNPFQLDSCPWCGSTIVPRQGSDDPADFGFTINGKSIILNCPDERCRFSDRLPVEVIDSRIFGSPPTILLATVDKFARIPFVEDSGVLLGAGTFAPPSLVIQDELHLLSGQLGTTVGVFDAAVFGIIGMNGGNPKIVASTATIRAADNQVRNLMSRRTAVFPPAGIDEDDSYFASPAVDRPGRVYLGLMPQAYTQSTSIIRAAAALLNSPLEESGNDSDVDAYWTTVLYHNSLRELGRTAVLLRDDVPGLLANKTNARGVRRELEVSRSIELTGRVDASDLPKALERLTKKFPDPDAIDTVICTNMLSVGIDISRLASMIMNGLPKTTSEYIQATSRVGRAQVPGVILTYFRPGRSRDRSVYENFHGYHQSLYRYVEPTSVTPWSSASRKRTIPAVLAAYVRHGAQLVGEKDASVFRFDDWYVDEIMKMLVSRIEVADPRETENLKRQVETLFREWSDRAKDEIGLQYYSETEDVPSLLRGFGKSRVGWNAANSMRSVDDEVLIKARFEKEDL